MGPSLPPPPRCTAPTCTDGIQNGDELGVDCSGSCAVCGMFHCPSWWSAELVPTSAFRWAAPQGGGGGAGPHAHGNAARQVVGDLRTEVWGQQRQSNDPRNNQHSPNTPTTGDPPQYAKGRTGDCPGPRKETTTQRNVMQGGLGWVWGFLSDRWKGGGGGPSRCISGGWQPLCCRTEGHGGGAPIQRQEAGGDHLLVTVTGRTIGPCTNWLSCANGVVTPLGKGQACPSTPQVEQQAPAPLPPSAVRTIGGHWLEQWTVGGEGRGEQARLEPNADIAT